MNLLQPLRFALAALVLTLLPSCGSDFRAAWKKAPVTEAVEGKWEGTWLSAANGHHGKLRCVVSEPHMPGKFFAVEGDHTFHYHATWMKILSGSYLFKGEHKMPDWAGGLYHYEGTIKGDDFRANYRCSIDNGTYTMKRVH